MCGQVISRDVIRRQARAAAEADFNAGGRLPDCPYQFGPYAKRWYAAYLEREVELQGEQKIISTFTHGPVEQLEVV